jgi:hypothetical protein
MYLPPSLLHQVLLIFTNMKGDLIGIWVNFDGNIADVPSYHSSPPYLQSQGYTFPITRTGLGDGTFLSQSSTLPGALPLLNTASYGVVPAHLQFIADLATRLKRRNRQVVEMMMRRGKVGIGSNLAKIRSSVNERDWISMMVKTAFLHGQATQQLRGQKSFSNPEVLKPTGDGGRVDPVIKILNQATENLHTEDGYYEQYFGPNSNGINHTFPPVIPLPGLP